MSVSASCVKLGYNEARELAELPAKIEILEQEQGDITPQIMFFDYLQRLPG